MEAPKAGGQAGNVQEVTAPWLPNYTFQRKLGSTQLLPIICVALGKDRVKGVKGLMRCVEATSHCSVQLFHAFSPPCPVSRHGG